MLFRSMKIRYNDGLEIQIEVDEEKKGYYIIPSGVQVLVENAIKHNIVSRKKPLHIVVETLPNNTLRVKNNLQIKMGDRDSNSLGLSNLNEQYRLMFGKEIVVSSANNIFSVELPLIKEREIDENITISK